MNIDSTKVNNYQNNLCEAIEVIGNSLLKKVSYDKTIVATITDVKDKKDGKYQCSNGTNTFTAYSTKTDYEKGSSVYVTIPNDNWENQKIIIGKRTGEGTESPFLYTTPLMSILDMTGNLIDRPLETEWALISNSTAAKDNNEIEIYSAEVYDDESTLVPSEMTRLVLSADFKTLLSGAVKGTYGIRISITGVPANSAIAEKGEEKDKLESYDFTNKQMFGNTYNFASYYNQQVSLDISNFNQIKAIRIIFFQEGDFSTNVEKLEWRKELFEDIFCKNVYLCAGKEVELFDEDRLNIWTDSGITYRKEYTDNNNKKIIKMSWVHVEDKIAKVMNKKNSENYYVCWYKYSVGVRASDTYCGTNWEKITTDKDYELSNEANWEYTFSPDTERQQSIIKAIIFKKIDEKALVCVCRSNELIFSNDEIVPSQETIDKDSALTIVVDDGSEGDYYLYGQDKRIYEETDRQRIRTLGCKFKENSASTEEDLYKPSDSFTYDSITWKFLKENSMFSLLKFTREDEKYYYVETKNDEEGPQYRLNRELKREKENVVVEFKRYGRTYTTVKEFNFGKRGTMGTDTTLIVNLKQDTKEAVALPYDGDISNYKLEIKIIKDGKEQGFTSEEAKDIIWTVKSNNKKKLSFSGETLFLSALTDINENSLLVATVEFGELSTQFAIPVFSSTGSIVPSYLVGPTAVVYDSAGLPDYKKEAFELYDVENKIIKDLIWEIYSPEIEEETAKEREKLNNYIGKIQNGNYLIPCSFYIKDAPLYGVRAKKDGEILWTQPVLVLQNRWASGVINNWDGKTLEINEENGYILSPAIAAGKKDAENSFSGVMIGDWNQKDNSDEITTSTGVYGFNKGVMAYALKDNGTAFFGAENNGRIYIDGTQATLYSANYLDKEKGYGMRISLGTTEDKPYLIMRQDSTVKTVDEQEYPFQIGSNFKIKWDGSICAKNGDFTGTLYATGGEIQGPLKISSKTGTLLLQVDEPPKTFAESQFPVALPLVVRYGEKGDYVGSFGIISGDDNGRETYNIGISSGAYIEDKKLNLYQRPSIILNSSNNIRLSTTSLDGGIYLDSNKPIYIKASYSIPKEGPNGNITYEKGTGYFPLNVYIKYCDLGYITNLD